MRGGGSALADEGAGGDTGALAAGGLAAQGTETDPDGTGGETGDAYAKFDSGTGTLTFFRSSEEYTTDQKETYIDEGGNEQTVTYYADIETTDWPASTSGFPRWRNHSSILTRVVFKDKIAPISTNGWFYAQRNLESIEGMEKLDTSKVTSMWYMFGLCQKLTELDVSHMDVSRVTNFGDMFASCSGLTELDLSGFDTSQAVKMSYMFGSCTSLTELDLSCVDTSNVTNMAQMFKGCERLAELDLSSFDTSRLPTFSMAAFTSGNGLPMRCMPFSIMRATGVFSLRQSDMAESTFPSWIYSRMRFMKFTSVLAALRMATKRSKKI